MDDIDAEIIRILCKDARTPFSRIGRMLGIGTDTVFRRFKNLKQEGKIAGSTIILSSNAIGIKGWCAFFIKLKSGTSTSSAREKMVRLPQLYGIAQIIGEYDFYLEMSFRQFEEIDTFVNSIRRIEEVVAIDPMFFAAQDWPLPTLPTLRPEILEWFLAEK